MRVCGIDIKANEIIVCVLSLDRGLFEAPEIRQRRINIANSDDPKQLRAFQQTVGKLMEDYKVDKIAIKARLQKGKFAGSASGFKLETALQLMESHRAYLISAAVIKETLKYNPLPVEFRDTGLKAYQEQAFMAAYTQLVGPKHPVKAEKEESETASRQTPQESEATAQPKPTASKKPHKEAVDEPSDKAQSSPWGQAKPRAKSTATDGKATTKKENPWIKRE